MKRYLLALAMAVLNTLSCAQTPREPADYQVVPKTCTPQKPRLPALYAKKKALKGLSPADPLEGLKLYKKYDDSDIAVEAAMDEVDLTGNGVCDLIVVVDEPISTGGDHEALATIYLANKGKWQRIGAQSAARSDLPADLDEGRSPTDSDFRFDRYVALRRPDQGPTYLVAWHTGRFVGDPFKGYRVYEIDPAHSALRLMDKWNNEGAAVYAAFKRATYENGVTIFKPDIEADELQELCEHITEPQSGLAAECSRIKR